jgi:hypothetical protein
MTEQKRTPQQGMRLSRRLRDVAKVGLGMASTVAVGGGVAAGCLDRPIDQIDPRTTSTNVQRLTQSSVDKIDVLLVIDNSGSMADKQQILSAAVPKLVQRLVTPQCVDPDGAPANPAVNIDGEGKCPDGYKPEFEPVRDINIGIISSSLGSAGNVLCDTTDRPNNQDLGHLLHRSAGGSTSNDLPTYEGLGFLAWDPDQKRPCPGQGSGGEVCAGESDPGNLISVLTQMVAGVGEVGCGLEMPLEAAYRFLADPKPWAAFTGLGQTEGVDEVLLDQRKSFLRPDSLVAVILLTDENDCSLRVDGIGQLAASPQGAAMPKPRSECAADPGDACCVSCIEPVPDGCSGDGGCAEPGSQTNPANFWPGDAPDGELDQSTALLRCHDQKRRFGIDFLYPTSRYVNAFSQTLINEKKLDLAIDGKNDVQNPLFTDLLDLGRAVRGPDLVFVAGIAGVPWQLIARKNEAGDPDLKNGIEPVSGLPIGGFQTYDELQQNGLWKQIIPESPADYADDPLMIESPFPRDGLSSDPDNNPINGNEWETNFGDLQYACIFDLPPDAQKECENATSCDCTNEADSPTGKPLCDGTLQVKAKAYPGTRIFEVLNGLGGQGIPASICPAQLGLGDGQSVDDKDYGYTPAVFAIIDRLKTKLGGACQPRQLIADTEGNVPCLVIEARDSDGDRDAGTDGKCNCNLDGRRDPEEGGVVAADQIRNELDGEEPSPGYDCLCEVVQLSGDDRTSCQNDQSPPNSVNGWCYIDATSVPKIGNEDLVGNCAPSERRLVRFVNEGEVSPGGRLYITCSGEVPGG